MPAKSMRASIGHIAALAFVEVFASGFTLLFSPPARLPASLAYPEVAFTWSGKAPPFEDKDTFRSGAFAGMTDEAVMNAAISEAMTSWNEVRGSYLKLTLTAGPEDLALDQADRVNAIVVSATNNLNSAASASPVIDKDVEGGEQIIDCDIIVDTAKVKVGFMIYAMTHEIGHCLGLGHAHDNYHALMGYSRTPGSTALGDDDKSGVIYLYGDPDYGDPKVHELISAKCGAVPGEAAPNSSGLPLMILLLPLAAAIMLIVTSPAQKACRAAATSRIP